MPRIALSRYVGMVEFWAPAVSVFLYYLLAISESIHRFHLRPNTCHHQKRTDIIYYGHGRPSRTFAVHFDDPTRTCFSVVSGQGGVVVRPASLNSLFATHSLFHAERSWTNGKIDPMIRFIGRVTRSQNGCYCCCWKSRPDDSLRFIIMEWRVFSRSHNAGSIFAFHCENKLERGAPLLYSLTIAGAKKGKPTPKPTPTEET